MSEGAHSRLGFSAIGGREAKGEKIAAILAAAGRQLKATDDVLDVGSGSGEIAEYLSSRCQMVCSDASDQRTHGLALPFEAIAGPLPFADASFDVVLSNHVIEHTPDPTIHLQEIRRVLRPSGVAYLATPNRLWPWEFHARLPLLHYLPWSVFSRIGMALGRLHEPVRLLSLSRILELTRSDFSAETWHYRILHEPDAYALSLPDRTRTLLRHVPMSILALSAPLQPTLIVLLSPK